MYVIEHNGTLSIWNIKPSEEYLKESRWFEYTDKIEGEGELCVDFYNKRIWRERKNKLTNIVGQLQQENKLLKAQLKAQTERSDFIEDCIAEMAGVVYNTEETTT